MGPIYIEITLYDISGFLKGSGAVERWARYFEGLYIAATIDRRFYRRLYKYVNRRYLIGFCGYTSVPQREAEL